MFAGPSGHTAAEFPRLKANPSRIPLPSIRLANVCSLKNKLNYLRLDLKTKHEMRGCRALIFMETWPNAAVPDNTTSVEELKTF